MFGNKHKYGIGDIITRKLTEEKVMVLKHLDSDKDERDMGPKYLIRTPDHKKLVIHEIELAESFNTATFST